MTQVDRAGSFAVAATTAQQRDALFSAVLIHDTIDLGAALPAAIRIDYGERWFAQFFALARAVWEDGVDRRALARIARVAAAGHAIACEDMAMLKGIRARFKQLRFAYAMFGRTHDYPGVLDRVTRTMGNFQDAMKHGGRLRRTMQAVALRLLATRPAFRRMTRGVDRFRPSDAASFRIYLDSEMAAIRAALDAPTMTVRRFHETRKIVSRLVAMYDCVDTLDPTPEHRATVRFLSTINGLMGAMHDDMVARRLARRRDDRDVLCELPDAVAIRLRQLERAFSAASGPQPA